MMPLALKHSSELLKNWEDVLQLKFTKLTNVCLKTAIAKTWEKYEILETIFENKATACRKWIQNSCSF